jgi:type II secretory pathway predicted ATPase ExeA
VPIGQPNSFALEPSTAVYVPRPATEAARAAIEAAICDERPVVALIGPAGLGKTLLLRLVRRACEARIHCAEIPVRARSLHEICRSAMLQLGHPTTKPVDDLVRLASRPGDDDTLTSLRSGVLLFIDEAEALAAEVVRDLLDLCTRMPRLQVVLAARAPAGPHPWLVALDPRIARVDLESPMTLVETGDYVRARLDLTVAPEHVQREFGPWQVLRLWRVSRGNPRALHLAAQALLVRAAGRGRPRRRPSWLLLLGLALLGAILTARVLMPAGEDYSPLLPGDPAPPGFRR